PSSFIPELPVKAYTCNKLKILILSGLDFHKNLWRLPEICTHLKSAHNTTIKFIISCSRDAFVHAYALDLRRQDFDDFIEFRGKIPQREIAEAYKECDILLSLSDLESFSNNYMEAWKSGMAQVCSDRDFARHICQNSAIYIEPHDTKAVAIQLMALTQQPQILEQCALEGKRRLASLPSLAMRVATIIEFIESTRTGTAYVEISKPAAKLGV
ncbi:MAG: glycosyltransferase family 1 protein, partial [Chitinophagaceae bacterium]